MPAFMVGTACHTECVDAAQVFRLSVSVFKLPFYNAAYVRIEKLEVYYVKCG